MQPQTIEIHSEYIKLDQFLKFSAAVSSGGDAKEPIIMGRVQVNGEVCRMRGKKLRPGDRVDFEGQSFLLSAQQDGTCL